jgi:single-strand DNA-binding protein
VTWGKLGEISQQYLRKGRLVLVEGRLQTRSYDSNGRKVYVTELIADRMQMLDSAKNSDGKSKASPSQESLEPALQAA